MEEKDLKEERKLAMQVSGERAFQRAGTASIKVLRPCWSVHGRARQQTVAGADSKSNGAEAGMALGYSSVTGDRWESRR